METNNYPWEGMALEEDADPTATAYAKLAWEKIEGGSDDEVARLAAKLGIDASTLSGDIHTRQHRPGSTTTAELMDDMPTTIGLTEKTVALPDGALLGVREEQVQGRGADSTKSIFAGRMERRDVAGEGGFSYFVYSRGITVTRDTTDAQDPDAQTVRATFVNLNSK